MFLNWPFVKDMFNHIEHAVHGQASCQTSSCSFLQHPMLQQGYMVRLHAIWQQTYLEVAKFATAAVR